MHSRASDDLPYCDPSSVDSASASKPAPVRNFGILGTSALHSIMGFAVIAPALTRPGKCRKGHGNTTTGVRAAPCVTVVWKCSRL